MTATNAPTMPTATIDGITVSDHPSGNVPSEPVHSSGSSVRFSKMTCRKGRVGCEAEPLRGEVAGEQHDGDGASTTTMAPGSTSRRDQGRLHGSVTNTTAAYATLSQIPASDRDMTRRPRRSRRGRAGNASTSTPAEVRNVVVAHAAANVPATVRPLGLVDAKTKRPSGTTLTTSESRKARRMRPSATAKPAAINRSTAPRTTAASRAPKRPPIRDERRHQVVEPARVVVEVRP